MTLVVNTGGSEVKSKLKMLPASNNIQEHLSITQLPVLRDNDGESLARSIKGKAKSRHRLPCLNDRTRTPEEEISFLFKLNGSFEMTI